MEMPRMVGFSPKAYDFLFLTDMEIGCCGDIE